MTETARAFSGLEVFKLANHSSYWSATEYITGRISISSAANVEGNYSTVTATFSLMKSKKSTAATYGTFEGKFSLEGKEITISEYITLNPNDQYITVATISTKVNHNADGTGKATAIIRGGIDGTSLGVSRASGLTLDTIPRAATITAAPNFNDEQNPTITYTNPAGGAVSSLAVCISIDGSADNIGYREVSKTGTSYTFNLTEDERNALRGFTTTSNSRTLYFFIRTIINGSTFLTSVPKTFSIINANPILRPTANDTGSTNKLTADKNKIIKYHNTMSVAANATAQKGATIKSYKITCGGKSITTATGTFNNVESGIFVFTATDSRGNTTTATVEKTVVPYIDLTCNVAAKPPTTDGNMSFTVGGNIYWGKFAEAPAPPMSNIFSAAYRYKENDGAYTDWIPLSDYEWGENKYSATVNLTGLNYRNTYTLEVKAQDLVHNGTYAPIVYYPAIVLRTTPVFDWGANDLQFNVPVSFNAGFVNDNKVLWSGANAMGAEQTITLNEAISAQMSGIVLIFSLYDGEAKNTSFNTFFISKKQVELLPDCGHTFIMGINAGFSAIGAKYLYFTDEAITGHSGNTASGSNSGITFDNNKYILRYVVGV